MLNPDVASAAWLHTQTSNEYRWHCQYIDLKKQKKKQTIFKAILNVKNRQPTKKQVLTNIWNLFLCLILFCFEIVLRYETWRTFSHFWSSCFPWSTMQVALMSICLSLRTCDCDLWLRFSISTWVGWMG